jgi:3-oxoacyl-[acyl-carrier-protein] synthase III
MPAALDGIQEVERMGESTAASHTLLLPVRIAGTASLRPGRAVTTAELVKRVTPQRDAIETEARTGIVSRHFADPESTASDLAAQALRQALTAAGLPAQALKRVIFVHSWGGELLAPATANLVTAALGLDGTCDCFDLNNACMGFLTALDIGARSVATGCGPVGIAVVELLSRFTTPEDPRPFLVLADGVAAVVLDEGRPGEGILGSYLRNDGKAGGDVVMAHPGLTHKAETYRFVSSNERISRNAVDAVKRAAAAVLAQAGLSVADVQWILPHQPNGSMLASIIRELQLDPDRVMTIVREVGSVGAASIPTSLDRLLRGQRVRPGDRILMVGVGAGISSGGILFQVAP